MTSLPRQVTLPFGYRITVVQVAKSVLPDAYADWDCDARKIRIRRSLSMRRKRYLLAHELTHALNDLSHFLLDSGLARTTP